MEAKRLPPITAAGMTPQQHREYAVDLIVAEMEMAAPAPPPDMESTNSALGANGGSSTPQSSGSGGKAGGASYKGERRKRAAGGRSPPLPGVPAAGVGGGPAASVRGDTKEGSRKIRAAWSAVEREQMERRERTWNDSLHIPWSGGQSGKLSEEMLKKKQEDRQKQRAKRTAGTPPPPATRLPYRTDEGGVRSSTVPFPGAASTLSPHGSVSSLESVPPPGSRLGPLPAPPPVPALGASVSTPPYPAVGHPPSTPSSVVGVTVAPGTFATSAVPLRAEAPLPTQKRLKSSLIQTLGTSYSEDQVHSMLEAERDKQRALLIAEEKAKETLQLEYEAKLEGERRKVEEKEWEAEKVILQQAQREQDLERQRMLDSELEDAREKARQAERERERAERWALEQERDAQQAAADQRDQDRDQEIEQVRLRESVLRQQQKDDMLRWMLRDVSDEERDARYCLEREAEEDRQWHQRVSGVCIQQILDAELIATMELQARRAVNVTWELLQTTNGAAVQSLIHLATEEAQARDTLSLLEVAERDIWVALSSLADQEQWHRSGVEEEENHVRELLDRRAAESIADVQMRAETKAEEEARETERGKQAAVMQQSETELRQSLLCIELVIAEAAERRVIESMWMEERLELHQLRASGRALLEAAAQGRARADHAEQLLWMQHNRPGTRGPITDSLGLLLDSGADKEALFWTAVLATSLPPGHRSTLPCRHTQWSDVVRSTTMVRARLSPHVHLGGYCSLSVIERRKDVCTGTSDLGPSPSVTPPRQSSQQPSRAGSVASAVNWKLRALSETASVRSASSDRGRSRPASEAGGDPIPPQTMGESPPAPSEPGQTTPPRQGSNLPPSIDVLGEEPFVARNLSFERSKYSREDNHTSLMGVQPEEEDDDPPYTPMGTFPSNMAVYLPHVFVDIHAHTRTEVIV